MQVKERPIGVYSLGQAGYEFFQVEDPERLALRWSGTETVRNYRVQFTAAGRAFVRPAGRRIYLDEVQRV